MHPWKWEPPIFSEGFPCLFGKMGGLIPQNVGSLPSLKLTGPQKEISSSNHQFSGAMLVSERVIRLPTIHFQGLLLFSFRGGKRIQKSKFFFLT